MTTTRHLIAAAACLALSACGGIPFFSGKGEKEAEVAKLESIDASVTVSKLWSNDIGSLDEAQYLRLVPVLADGRIYASDSRGRVAAFDPESGKQLWRTEVKEQVSGGTGSADGLVLVGTINGRALALDAASGAQKWSAQLSSEILSPPTGGTGVVVAHTIDGKVFGLDAASGQKQWIYERSVPSLSLRGTAPPLVYEDVVLTGFASGKIVANELRSGRVRWELTVGEARGRSEIERLVDVDAKPRVVDGTMYVGAYQGNVLAVSVDSGRTQWSRQMSTLGEIGVDASNVYVTEAGGKIVAMERASGNDVWTQDALHGRDLSGPVVVGDKLVVVDHDGYLHVLAADSGRLIGRAKIGNGARGASPIADGNRFYILEAGGDLAAYTLR
jgi:outer membrane protein assembly factor BamB